MSLLLRSLRQAHTMSGARGVNYFPHLSKTKGINVTQERTEGHNLQGRDSTAQYFYRNSMADPEYTVNDSRRQRLVPRGLVTPTVHVAEGAAHVSTADFPSPLRHSLADPDAFDVDPKFNRKIT